jgi:hypothetical protein
MTTRSSNVAALRIALCIVALALTLPADAHYQFLSKETDAFRVELIRWERYGERYSEVRFGLLITEVATGEERQVEIDNLLTGIERLEIAQGILLAFGDVGGHFEGVTLVRLATAEITDFILSYGSDLSPSKRYLVFRKFYPPRGMPATQSDAVLVYDLSRQPSANRLPQAHVSVMGESVGLPVYPRENVDPPSYRVWIPDRSQQHFVEPWAGFLWAPDEKSLYFVDRTRNQQLLIRVDLAEGLGSPQILVRLIDPESALATDPREGKPVDEEERRYLAITGMQFDHEGRIRLDLDRQMFGRKIYRVDHIILAPPEAPLPTQEQAKETQ